MIRPYPDALSLSHRVLGALIRLNVLMGVLILGMLVTSIVAEEFMMKALGVHQPEDNAILIRGMRLIMVIGIAAVPLTHLVLSRLLAIVETVRAGDPFISLNAARLQRIAWAVVGLELLHFGVGAAAAYASSGGHPLDLDWSFSFTRWIVVLLLFVLARVFDQGARMREDLEGTV